MPELTVNGRTEYYEEDAFPGTVAALLAALGLGEKTTVAEVNGEIVPRDAFADTSLQSGSVVELVQFVGGG